MFLYIKYGGHIESIFDAYSINDTAVSYLVLFPVMVVAWVVREGDKVLFSNERPELVVSWSGYWMIKSHFHVGIFNSIIFLLPCLIIWSLDFYKDFSGFYFLLVFTVALIINAFSFYLAGIRLKEIMLKVSNE